MKDIYKTIGIYRITNKENGMSYIGKTGMNFGDRWDSHRALLRSGKHDNPYLQNAWNKYGESCFEFVVVEVVADASLLNELEMKYIAEYRKMNLSYNLHDGGDGGYNLGKHLSDVTKRRIGEKNRVNMTGRHPSEETRRRMSASHQKRYDNWTDDERKEFGKRMSKCSSGYKWSEEARSAFSKVQREHPNSAKFTPDDIREIRRKKANGAKLTELAKEYNTSPVYISHIVHRRRWEEID